MRKRIVSAIIGISLILAVIFVSLYHPVSIVVFAVVVCTVSVFEFMKAVKTATLFQVSIPSLLFAFAYPTLVSYGFSTIVCSVYTGLMLSMIVFFYKKISFKDFAYTYSMTMIITLSLSMLVLLKDDDMAHSTMYFVFSLAIPWLADAGAYFVGVFFGKHKLCPQISPKKTIEGAVGGVAICVGVSCLAGLLFDEWIYGNEITLNYWMVALVSFFGAVLSILGDLSFSVIKRSYAVKDYGELIPGHGGMLDRFDSVIFVVPLLYIIVKYLPIVA